ncbi:MAG: hypothetical protein ACI88A_003235, partial [Paraglaciecola sp.]
TPFDGEVLEKNHSIQANILVGNQVSTKLLG